MDGQRGTAGERLDWDACLNARDIGGYATASGGETRWGSIVRADGLFRLSAAGQQALRDYGVTTIIDLRNASELTNYPNPFAAMPPTRGPNFHHLAFEDETDRAARAAIDAAGSAQAIYREMLTRYQRRVGGIMEVIAGAPEGGVLVHCHAGMDRTGLIVALLLHLVEMPNQTIAEDYALSMIYWQPEFDIWLASIADPRQRDEERQRWSQPEAIMLGVLDDLATDHGGAAAYLRAAGVSDTTIDRLRTRLLG